MPMIRTILVGLILLPTTGYTYAQEWARFRGPSGTGISSSPCFSNDLSLGQVAWKLDLASGGSSIVAWKEKLFTTSYDGESRVLTCMAEEDGKTLWSQSFKQLRKETATPPNDAATCSPVCDGSVVCAWFPDTGLVVCDMDGRLLWQKDLGPLYSMHGVSASPILADGKIILAVDQLQAPYIAAFDAGSGKELWKVDRLIGITGGYSTPVLVEVAGKSLVVSAAPGEMVGYELSSGERAFSVAGLTNAPVGVPVVHGNRIYYSEPPGEPIPMEALGPADQNKDGVIELAEVKGSQGTFRLIERIDNGFGNSDGQVDKTEWDKAFGTFLNNGGLSCVELNERQGVFAAEVLWRYSKSTPYISSVLMLDDLVYIINDGGVLLCLDTTSGEVVKRGRLTGATGQYYASPVSDGKKLLLANLAGQLSLVEAGREWKSLSTLDLEESIVATPSLHNGKIYVRTVTQLFCFDALKSK